LKSCDQERHAVLARSRLKAASPQPGFQLPPDVFLRAGLLDQREHSPQFSDAFAPAEQENEAF